MIRDLRDARRNAILPLIQTSVPHWRGRMYNPD
jgi:hypothetical protein